MPTSCNTHDYDGKLREKWFQMRPMLLEKYLPNCLSFDDTIAEIEEWLDKKYYNVKRIGRARRSIKILTSQRRGNFDSRNEIDVEELLPILWNQVKSHEDIHDTFYEQFCDITGGSCSQGRSTRLFQFLFLFDLPLETSTTPVNTEEKEGEETKDISAEKESITKDLAEMTLDNSTISVLEERPQSKDISNPDQEQQLKENQQLQEESHVKEKEQSHDNEESNAAEQTNSSPN